MEITQEHKDNVKKKILESLANALENEEIETAELPEIGGYVLDNMKDITTKDHMMSFLQKLSAKWRVFSIVLVLESGEYKLQEERKAVHDALLLLKKGQTDDALKVVKGVLH